MRIAARRQYSRDHPTRWGCSRVTFTDRAEAGRQLAEALAVYADRPDALVLALPRGGVPVGYEVARCLRLPLDVYVVRKLGVPGHAELAMGALANDGTCVVDEKLIHSLRLDDETLEEVISRESEEICRREETYRDRRPQADVSGKTVILVDDGLATGATMRVAATAVRRGNPTEIVVAVPVAAYQTCLSLREVADRVICPYTPGPFVAVGLYYENFDQTSDDEVRRLLAAAAETGRRMSA